VPEQSDLAAVIERAVRQALAARDGHGVDGTGSLTAPIAPAVSAPTQELSMKRIHGPFRHGRKWRLVIVREDDTREKRSFDTEGEAEAEAIRLRAKCVPGPSKKLSVTSAIEKYEEMLRKRNKAKTVDTTVSRLRSLLKPSPTKPISIVTTKEITKVVEALPWAYDTKRIALVELRTFCRWLMKKGYIRKDPSEGIEVEGKRRRGKPQLMADEARRFLAKALELAPTEPGALASALALLMGLRISEITDRVVRDLDQDGTVLAVPGGKTENARRRVRIPTPVRPLLAAYIKGKAPGDPILGITRYTGHYWCRKICKLAAVPVVSPHGLRGTNATLRYEVGEVPERIAAELGQGSFEGVTARFYVSDDSLASRGLDLVEKTLGTRHQNPSSQPSTPVEA
jgi:integrase